VRKWAFSSQTRITLKLAYNLHIGLHLERGADPYQRIHVENQFNANVTVTCNKWPF